MITLEVLKFETKFSGNKFKGLIIPFKYRPQAFGGLRLVLSLLGLICQSQLKNMYFFKFEVVLWHTKIQASALQTFADGFVVSKNNLKIIV